MAMEQRVRSTSYRDGELVQSFERYAEAQAAVDGLSDGGFPVEQLSIVWVGLRRVETVTGRRTVGRAFLEGAAAGAWFGLALGLLLVLLVDVEDANDVSIVLWYVAIAAVATGAFTAIGHWMRRGRRDFASIGFFDAERYDVTASPDVAGDARARLNVRTTRPIDPPPAATS